MEAEAATSDGAGGLELHRSADISTPDDSCQELSLQTDVPDEYNCHWQSKVIIYKLQQSFQSLIQASVELFRCAGYDVWLQRRASAAQTRRSFPSRSGMFQNYSAFTFLITFQAALGFMLQFNATLSRRPSSHESVRRAGPEKF